MIQEKPSANPMFRKESFDEFYSKKLEALAVELKAIIKGDIVYATSAERACKVCKARIKLYSQCEFYCMKCCMPPDLMPATWSKELKRAVFRILQSYPSLEESHVEYEALQQAPTPHEVTFARITGKQGDIELGKRIRDARIAKGWSREDLAKQVFKQFFQGNIAPSSIQGYENGNANPSQYVLKQLKKLLGLEGTQNV